ncbi:peptidylprolyl isomerase [Palleronia sediminis]|uniref:Peptidylprolyl isomerase n=1 Tax=Palleronia sediminis TaxID=2547833 RepID=A0A4V3BAQ6_9RHOB|nr:peptidylprolyl isomerase [Palleronia sediminis]TDL84109.1 peptidylprolyl isomerase [Palleronia sediminis]
MAKGKNPITRIAVWIVLLLLIVGLAGFGATSFGGSTRVVATVGDTEIGVDEYARALQQEIRAITAQTGQAVSIAEARAAGIDRAVLGRLVTEATLEDEAAALGLSVGDARVAEQVSTISGFQGLDGSFDREAYRFALDRAGLSIAEFEEQLRDETARAILQGALVSGIDPPEAFVDALYDFARETRDLTLIRFGPETLEDPVGDPTEAQLEAYHASHEEAFTLPRRKAVTYAWVTPEAMTGEVSVDEDALRRLYDDRAETYNLPERRLVERLVFPDTQSAQTAADAIAAGETDFETLVEDRGLALGDIDLGEVARADLGPAAEPVFALDGPGIAGPVETALGPALFRVNAILAAQETPFDEVRDDLRAEYAMDAARRALQDQIEPVEDLLAGGATLEDLAAETPLELGQTVWSPGDAGESGAAIDAYPAFRAAVEAAEPGDFPELGELSDGGLFALRVDEVLEPELQPLDAVRDEVAEAWVAEERRQRILAAASEALERLREGTPPTELGGTATERGGVLRDAFIEDAPEDLVPTAFALEAGAAEVLPTGTGALIVRVDAITPPDPTSAEAQAIKAGVAQAAGQGIAGDIANAFTEAVRAQKGVTVNQQAINAVLSQFN